MDARRFSGFLVGICATAGASAASTCSPGYYDPAGGSSCIPAPLGSYVPTGGATAATPAPLGSYVNVTGATAATLASPGTYVNATGQTSALNAPAGSYVPSSGASNYFPAPVGYYVATSGASAATPAGPGNYTTGTGATAPIAGGMLASTLNMAATGVHELLGSQQAMGDTAKAGFDISVKSGSTRLDQAGLRTSSTQSLRANSLVVQHRSGTAVSDWRLFGGFADQQLKSIAAGTGDGRTWLLGIGRGLGGAPDAPVFFNAYAGQTSSDIVRLVTETSPTETQKHAGTVRIAGLQLTGGMPVTVLSARLLVEGGVNYFQQAAITETATTTGTTAGLKLAQANLWTLPAFIGLEHQLPGLRIQWGWRGELNPRRELTASLASGGSYNFAIPVQGTSASAGVIRLCFSSLPLGQGFALDGGVQVEAGPKLHQQQAQLTLSKRW